MTPPKLAVQLGAIHSVLEERDRQDAQWGEQDHDAFTWLAILAEEMGEAAQEALTNHFGGTTSSDLRTEVVQIAAVALAFVESIDRRQA